MIYLQWIWKTFGPNCTIRITKYIGFVCYRLRLFPIMKVHLDWRIRWIDDGACQNKNSKPAKVNVFLSRKSDSAVTNVRLLHPWSFILHSSLIPIVTFKLFSLFGCQKEIFLGAVAPLGLAMSLSPSAFLKYGLGIVWLSLPKSTNISKYLPLSPFGSL